MEKYQFLLFLALILLFTKLFGVITAKVHLPQVVGALIAGVILGPSVLGFIDQNDFLIKISEIGVIMLMFLAGIDTDIDELKKTGPAACLIASLGVLVPIIMCGGAYLLFFGHNFKFETMMKASFIGVVFAATSVSITVETLNEMGKLKSKVGTALLSAAIIDDIIGIVVLSVLSGLGGSSESPVKVIVKILLFFVFTFAVGFIVYNVFKKLSVNHSHHRRIAIWALAFCLIMAFCAEKLFGVADITGAYFAGVILCNLTDMRPYVAKKINVASYLFFSPVFFASIGLKTNLREITSDVLLFALVLTVCAVLSKIIGCGAASKLCRMSNSDSLKIGVGMVARGEVALMVAQKGLSSGYIDEKLLPAIVLTVVICALITPVLLKLTYKEKI